MELNRHEMATIVAALELLKGTKPSSIPPGVNDIATMGGEEDAISGKLLDSLIESVRSNSGIIKKTLEYSYDQGISRGKDASAMLFSALFEFLNEDGVIDLPEKESAEAFISGFVVGLGEEFKDCEANFELTSIEFLEAMRTGYESLMMDEEVSQSQSKDDGCAIKKEDFLEELHAFMAENKGLKGPKQCVIFDVNIALGEGNDVWVGFLTPDEFAMVHKDSPAQDLQQDYVHWYETHLLQVTKFLREEKIKFGFFSEIALTKGSNLVERDGFYVENSPHDFDTQGSAKQCVALLVTNGQICICTILMFIDENGELTHQKNLFPLDALKRKTTPDLDDLAHEIIGIVDSLASQEEGGCKFMGMRATNELVFCEEHRAITANVIALVSEDELPRTRPTMLH